MLIKLGIFLVVLAVAKISIAMVLRAKEKSGRK